MAKVILRYKTKEHSATQATLLLRVLFSPPPAVCGPRLTGRTEARGPFGLWTVGDGVPGTSLLL